MMRADEFKSDVYPVRTEMTYMKQITPSHVCSTKNIELKVFVVDETLSHIYSMDKDK